jgi:hypothetical protein
MLLGSSSDGPEFRPYVEMLRFRATSEKQRSVTLFVMELMDLSAHG